jgi:hypothetical protein
METYVDLKPFAGKDKVAVLAENSYMSLNLVSTLMSGKKTREEYIALTKYDYGALPEE